jgi:ligand-binding SRPBCC domain-containing protein
MARVVVEQFWPFPVGVVFAFFLRPANLVRAAPPELHLRLVSGPDRIAVGSRVTVQARRWGLGVRLVTEVTRLEEGALLVEEQREGPLREWVVTRRFEPVAGGTRLTEKVEYEPPGGLLGRVLTERVVEEELRRGFAYREGQVAEALRGAKGPGEVPAG